MLPAPPLERGFPNPLGRVLNPVIMSRLKQGRGANDGAYLGVYGPRGLGSRLFAGGARCDRCCGGPR